MTETTNVPSFKFSPNVRLRMALSKEIERDSEREFFNEKLLHRYIGMHDKASAKQESLIKSLLAFNAILAMIVFGKNFTLPFIKISTQEIPAATEIFVLLSSFSFMMLATAFTNTQLYYAACEVLIDSDAKKKSIDSDYILAGYVYTEIYVKMFQKRISYLDREVFSAGIGYSIFYSSIILLLSISILSLLLLHFILLGYALWVVSDGFWVSAFVAIPTITLNILAVLIFTSPSFKFSLKENAK
jgi:hypothetical protein